MEGKVPSITLNDGLVLPMVGFGTYRLNGAAGINAITSAIDVGYRLIDSAFNYENEGAVGQAVKRSSMPRNKLLITSKLPGRHHEYAKAVTTIQESLYRAGLDYYDLYLIHWPNPSKDLYVEAWQALIDAKRWGLIRSIGVCNFLPQHMERLNKETGVLPSINQIELHPLFSQQQQRQWDAQNGVATQSWSPLGRTIEMFTQLPELQAIAAAHQKSVVQVILRWHTQMGCIPIPKASAVQRQQDNLDIFDFTLTPQEMETIGKLTRADGRTRAQDPAIYEEF